MACRLFGAKPLSRVTLYTAGHLHTAVPHCSHSRAPIVHTAVPRENNEHGCVYLRCTAVCKLPGCVEGHPWLSKPTLSFCQLKPQEQTSVNFYPKYKTFHSRKCIWKYRLRNGGHFVHGRWVKVVEFLLEVCIALGYSGDDLCWTYLNSLWPTNAIWHRSRSTLAQVMVCCLTAPSHYPNQC